MNEREYQTHFGGTAFTRAKRNGLRRNTLIAMWVTQRPDLEKALQSASEDCGSPLAEAVSQIECYSFEFRCDS